MSTEDAKAGKIIQPSTGLLTDQSKKDAKALFAKLKVSKEDQAFIMDAVEECGSKHLTEDNINRLMKAIAFAIKSNTERKHDVGTGEWPQNRRLKPLSIPSHRAARYCYIQVKKNKKKLIQ